MVLGVRTQVSEEWGGRGSTPGPAVRHRRILGGQDEHRCSGVLQPQDKEVSASRTGRVRVAVKVWYRVRVRVRIGL